MPKIDAVVNLIRAIGANDQSLMKKIVEQMIANERESNHKTSAQKLEYALRNWPIVLKELPHNLKNIVWPETNVRKLSELLLDHSILSSIEFLLRERNSFERLHEAGLSVRKSILLAGPPGNGKTSLASALANELGLQFISVKMHGLIDSHLGESGRNIGQVFDFASTNECLLFIDEIDAIGSKRGGNNGAEKEYNNIVTILLANMDRLPDSCLLIAATNMPDAIDPAIRRRFDLKVWLNSPNDAQIERYISQYENCRRINFEIPIEDMVTSLHGKPWSEIELVCMDQHKKQILGEQVMTSDWIGRHQELAI